IKHLSPKAAATLARRAMQSMIRDKWKVSKPTLFEEINAIDTLVDASVRDALHAVRKVGNIGAHMKQETDRIVEIEEGEAEKLRGLISYLSREWYQLPRERRAHLESLKQLAASKAEDSSKG